MTENYWQQVLPGLAESADKLTKDLLDTSNVISLPEKSTVFRQGDACKNYLIVLDGKVKVYDIPGIKELTFKGLN